MRRDDEERGEGKGREKAVSHARSTCVSVTRNLPWNEILHDHEGQWARETGVDCKWRLTSKPVNNANVIKPHTDNDTELTDNWSPLTFDHHLLNTLVKLLLDAVERIRWGQIAMEIS